MSTKGILDHNQERYGRLSHLCFSLTNIIYIIKEQCQWVCVTLPKELDRVNFFTDMIGQNAFTNDIRSPKLFT
jgi:hypothetical protein